MTTPSTPPAATEGDLPPLSDADIEALFIERLGNWDGNVWIIEDADLHPFVRAAIAADRARTAAPQPSTINHMCERKTNDIMQRDGYAKSGYVLRAEGKNICVSDGAAVAWFTPEQWQWLMHGRDHVEFAWPKPIGAAPQPSADSGQETFDYDEELRDLVEAYTKSVNRYEGDWTNESSQHWQAVVAYLDGKFADLRAQLARQGQGEAVAIVDAGEEGLFVEILIGRDGSPLKLGDKLYLGAPTPTSAVQGENTLAIIRAVQTHIVDVVRAYGNINCAAYISTWHKPEQIAAAIRLATSSDAISGEADKYYAQEFLNWNRALEKPAVEIGKEMYVARKAVELYFATTRAQINKDAITRAQIEQSDSDPDMGRGINQASDAPAEGEK